MNESKKRTFELTAAFAMGNLLGKLMANKTFSAVPELSDRSRARIEELIASASASKDMTESVVKETDPEFWDELSGLEIFKGELAIIEFMARNLKEKKERAKPFEDKKMPEKTKVLAAHSMGQFYGNLFLIGELSRIEDLSPEVKEMLETIKQAAERHKEFVVKTLMIFNPDLLSLIHEIEADQDLDPGKELAS